MIKPSPGGEILNASDFQIQAVVHSLEFFEQNYKTAYSGYYECSLSIILLPVKNSISSRNRPENLRKDSFLF